MESNRPVNSPEAIIQMFLSNIRPSQEEESDEDITDSEYSVVNDHHREFELLAQILQINSRICDVLIERIKK